jgi:succinate dehydrogenase/fumarate reductase iron-sulfur protein
MTFKEVSIEVFRYDPLNDKSPYWRVYTIPFEEKNTVLGALLYIQEELDPSLAFRFTCRYKRCGLCALEVNGKPRMACHTYLKDGMRIGPLSNLPLVKDLVVDRQSLFEDLQKHFLYFDVKDFEEKTVTAVPIIESPQGAKLRGCMECLSCLATCPEYLFGNKNFAGPFIFVKLAQLHFDPRDNKDLRKQAFALGITRCRDCRRKCYCVNGINIYQEAISNLLQQDHLL